MGGVCSVREQRGGPGSPRGKRLQLPPTSGAGVGRKRRAPRRGTAGRGSLGDGSGDEVLPEVLEQVGGEQHPVRLAVPRSARDRDPPAQRRALRLLLLGLRGQRRAQSVPGTPPRGHRDGRWWLVRVMGCWGGAGGPHLPNPLGMRDPSGLEFVRTGGPLKFEIRNRGPLGLIGAPQEWEFLEIRVPQVQGVPQDRGFLGTGIPQNWGWGFVLLAPLGIRVCSGIGVPRDGQITLGLGTLRIGVPWDRGLTFRKEEDGKVPNVVETPAPGCC